MFANASDGFAALIAWADRHAGSHPLHFGMEATGPYSHGLATHRHAAGRVVSVVNPTRGELRHRLGAATVAGAGDIRATADWLGLWQQSDAKSIEGDLRFTPRPDGPKAGPPTLDRIDQPSGVVPAWATGRE